MLIRCHGPEILPNLRKAMMFDWHDDKGKENYPRIFFVKSFHTETFEEHHILSSEIEHYNWCMWDNWMHNDMIYLPKKKINIEDDQYGIKLATEINEL